MPAPSPPGIEETSSEGATEEGVSLPRPPQPSAQGYLRVRAVRRVFISRGGCVVGGLWAEPAEPAKPWALEDRGAVLWSVGWRLTPLTVTVVDRRGGDPTRAQIPISAPPCGKKKIPPPLRSPSCFQAFLSGWYFVKIFYLPDQRTPPCPPWLIRWNSRKYFELWESVAPGIRDKRSNIFIALDRLQRHIYMYSLTWPAR